MYNTEKQAGFALLISLLVVGVVISVGLSILDLSIKQVRLASNATESEKAFHAANAGIECARYWRRVLSMQIEDGMTLSPSPTCFGGIA
jgi:Tfp pilus assembly protein PilX